MADVTRGHGVFELFTTNGEIERRRLTSPLFNTWMDTWAWLAVRLFAQRDVTASLSHFYVEYANVTTAGDQVPLPSFSTADPRDYYDALAADPIRDYLRVPLLGGAVITSSAAFAASLASPRGNQVTLLGAVGDGVGENGKPFSGAVNSTVCGLAIVAAANPLDRTQDVLFSRAYYPLGAQALKPESSTLMLTYTASFGDEEQGGS